MVPVLFKFKFTIFDPTRTFALFSLQGLSHKMNIFWRFIILNWYFLYLCLWLFYFFPPCWWNNQSQSFSLLLWNYLIILKILSVTLFKEILTLKMNTGSRLWFCKIISETTCDKLILEHFLCSNDGSTLENINQPKWRELMNYEEGFSKHFQISK